jgi:hypothetical protein
MFVAVDRVSKFAYAELHEKATRRVVGDFLRKLIALVPIRSTPCSPTMARTHRAGPEARGDAIRQSSAALSIDLQKLTIDELMALEGVQVEAEGSPRTPDEYLSSAKPIVERESKRASRSTG